MALLERVTTLLRANVNDLITRAEHPEKMLRQLLLDMENQLLQVKTQVAITLADLHLLETKAKEHRDSAQSWQQKAALAVSRGEDDLARAALDRSLSHQQLAQSFTQQVEDQRSEADTLRGSYNKLQQKLKETEAQCELVLAQGRRAKAIRSSVPPPSPALAAATSASAIDRTLDRIRHELQGDQAIAAAHRTLLAADLTDTLDERFRRMEREEQIESILHDLKRLPVSTT
jgi:phage shock protein A